MKFKIYLTEFQSFMHKQAVPKYLRGSSMSDWLSYDKVKSLPMTSKEHAEEAMRLEQEEPNPATPKGRIANSLARLHRQVASGKRMYGHISGTDNPLVQRVKADLKHIVFGGFDDEG